MRFSLYFTLAHNRLPTELRRSIISFIKNALTEANDGRYFTSFFQNTINKCYTFSVVLDKPVFSSECITIEKPRMKVSFSATDESNGLGRIFLNCLIKQKHKTYPLALQNQMTLDRIQLEREQKVANDQVLVRTSPGGGLVVRNHDRDTNKDSYYCCDDADFVTELERSLSDQLDRAGFKDTAITVTVAEAKKVIVSHFGLKLPVTVGYFILSGNRFTLQYLLDAGIGSRRSQGFGKIDKVQV